jgi:hypothetical protein
MCQTWLTLVSMRAFTAVYAFVISAAAMATILDKIDLTRKYKEGETNKYAVSVKIEEGNSQEISGKVLVRVKKATAGKLTEVEMLASDVKMLNDGQTADSPTPPTTTYNLDEHQIPESLSVGGDETIYTALSVASYLPAKPLEVGEMFKVAWKSKVDGSKIDGDGKLVEVIEKDGKKLAHLRSKVDFLPGNQKDGADMEIDSTFDLSTGWLVDSKVKGTVPNGTFLLSISLSK